MLKELLEELRRHNRAEISYKSGVSLGTLNHLLSGAARDPKLSTVQALQKFLEDKEQEAK